VTALFDSIRVTCHAQVERLWWGPPCERATTIRQTLARSGPSMTEARPPHPLIAVSYCLFNIVVSGGCRPPGALQAAWGCRHRRASSLPPRMAALPCSMRALRCARAASALAAIAASLACADVSVHAHPSAHPSTAAPAHQLPRTPLSPAQPASCLPTNGCSPSTTSSSCSRSRSSTRWARGARGGRPAALRPSLMMGGLHGRACTCCTATRPRPC